MKYKNILNLFIGIEFIIILSFITDFLPDVLFGIIGIVMGLTLHFLSFIAKKRNQRIKNLGVNID